MCIIIDANRATVTFANPPDPDGKPVIDWVSGGKGKVVYGGQLTKELAKVASARHWLAEAKRGGRAQEIPSDRIEADMQSLVRGGLLRSDDAHILALARVSGARLLFTHDQDLIDDFKDPQVINNPRGSVYKSCDNSRMLRPDACML